MKRNKVSSSFKRIQLSFILILFSIFGFSQSHIEQKHFFLDENENLISQKQFIEKKWSNEHQTFLDISYLIDGSIYHKLFRRKIIGILNEKDLYEVKKILNNNGKENSNSDFVIVEYLEEDYFSHINAKNFRGYVYQKKFAKDVAKKKNTELVYLSCPELFKEAQNLDTNFRKFKEDRNNSFKEKFYPDGVLLMNLTIISKTGKYITFLGEHGPDEVFKYLNEIQKL